MSSLFAGLKEKFADKLAEFKGATTPQDPNEKYAFELVEAATSDELIAPDWNLNFKVVDFANSDVRLNSGRTLRAIKRSLAKPNTKVQLLSLTLLESCVKNCPAEFHIQLAASELWMDVVKLADDTSINRVDAEVRDKVLGMVEDFSRVLQPSQFQAAYESLLDKGVDFPVRAPEDSVPILTPPASAAAAAAGAALVGHAEVAAAAPQASGDAAAAAAAVPAAALPPGADGAGAAADPLDGLDEQDRVAIRAALAELEAEAAAAQEAARVAAEADKGERRQMRLQQQQQQQQQLLLQQQQQQQMHQQQAAAEAQAALGLLAAAQTAEAAAAAAAAQAVTASDGATADIPAAATATAGGLAVGVPVLHAQHPNPAHPAGPGVAEARPRLSGPPEAAERAEEPSATEEHVANLLETANNTTLLLSEMLASVPDTEPLAVREPYVAEIAETCIRLRSGLERHLVTLSDEALLSTALSQHEELSRVLQRYEELLAAAEALAPTVPRNAAAVALSHAAASRGVPPGAVPYGQPDHAEQHQAQAQAPAAAAAAVPTGQKVAAVAAALKERFTGAFDKLMAAAAAARAPGTQAAGGPAAPSAAGGAALGAAPGPGGGEVGVSLAVGAGGAFTLLDEEDEEANEGTSLIAKRTTRQVGDAAAMGVVAAAPPAPVQPQLQLQQLVDQATGATVAVPPLPPPPPPAPAGPDLINFDEDAPAPAATAPHPAQQAAAAPHPAPGTEPPASADGAPEELLTGLTIHSLADASGGAAAAGDASTTAAAASPVPVTPPPPPLQPLAASCGGSNGDDLVEELDRLMQQSSVNASPGEAQGAPHEAGAAVATAAAGVAQPQL